MPFLPPPTPSRILLFCLLAGARRLRRGTERPVRVSSVKFTGVKAVKTGQLKSVLATVQSSKLPWGTKHYFTREQFEADLKRIVAFYRTAASPTPRSSRSTSR